jgi:hypothetical protein
VFFQKVRATTAFLCNCAATLLTRTLIQMNPRLEWTSFNVALAICSFGFLTACLLALPRKTRLPGL